MPFDIKLERFPQYVRYEAAGKSSFKRVVGLVMRMAEDIETYEDDRVLVDLRKVEGRLNTEEQILVGEVVARKMPLLFKMASIVPVGEVTRNSEKAAVRGGLNIRVFDSEQAAVAWLLEGQPG